MLKTIKEYLNENKAKTKENKFDILLEEENLLSGPKSGSPQALFFQLYLALQLISLVSMAVFHGKYAGNIVWSGKSSAIFPDFVQTLWHSYGFRPYELHAIYPPLIYAFGGVLTRFLPESIMQEIGKRTAYDNWANASTYPAVHALTVAFFALATLFLVKVICRILSNKDTRIKNMVLWTVLSSVPYIFTVERGNVVILAVAALLYYANYYNSEDAKQRWLAYLGLSVAVSLKLYPVLMSLLILQGEKKWKRAGICILTGAATLFLPFLCTGGFESCLLMVSNLTDHVGVTADNLALRHKVGIYSTLKLVDEFTQISVSAPEVYETLGKVLPIAVIILGCAGCFLANSTWKKCASLVVSIVLFPSFSLQYNVLYLIIPLILFVKEDAWNKIDYFYSVLFALCLSELAFGSTDILQALGYDFSVNLGMIVPAVAMIILLVAVFIEGIITRLKKTFASAEKEHKIDKKYLVCFVIIVAALVAGLSALSLLAENYITREYTPGFEVTSYENVYDQETSVDHLGEEMQFNWVNKTAIFDVENTNGKDEVIAVSFRSGEIMTLQDGEYFEIKCGEQKHPVKLKQKGQLITVMLNLKPGSNRIEITSNAARVSVNPQQDARKLYFTLQDFTITDTYNNCQVMPLNGE